MSCSCDMDLLILWIFFWLSGPQTFSVALKFCDLPQTHCLCSCHSTLPSCASTVPVSGFRNMTCKVHVIKWAIHTLFVSKNTYKESREDTDGTCVLLSPNQTEECSTKDRALLSDILSSQRQHKGEIAFGYQQTLSNLKISTGCCDSELFTM